MKALIAQLKDLNKLDLQLRMLKKDLERLPRELASGENLPRSLRSALERGRAEITRLKMEADGLELEVKSGEDALKRLATQMNVMRSSKEFETVRRQMDAQRGWNRENTDKALELLEKVDLAQKQATQTETALADAEKAQAAEAVRVEQEMAEMRVKVQALTTERAGLTKDLPEKELVTYDRIVYSRGDAIAHVNRGICSACYMKLPPQIHNLALLAKDLVCCPSCGRILTA